MIECPYCGGKLIINLYIICPRCKLAMTLLEYQIALTSKDMEGING